LIRMLPNLAAVALCVGSCTSSGAGTDQAGRFTLQDSSGIRIVITEATEWTGVDTLEPQAMLRVHASDEGATSPIGSVGAGELLEDGRIAVLDRIAQTVVFYAPDGREAFRFGRKGQGPGEFSAAVTLQEQNDGAVLVYDRALGRLTEVLPDGAAGNVTTLAAELFERPPYYAWRLADGRVVTWEIDVARRSVEGQSGDARRAVIPGTLRISDLQDGTSDTVFTAPAREMIEQGSRLWFGPFGPVAVMGIRHDVLYFSTAERHEVRVIGLDDGQQGIYRFPGLDEAVARSELSRLEDEGRSEAADLGVEFEAGVIFDPALQPPIRPAFEGLRVAGDGVIWAKQQEPFSGGDSEWWVVSANGHFRGRVGLPTGATILSMGTDVMLVSVLDDFDVPSIELWLIPQELSQ